MTVAMGTYQPLHHPDEGVLMDYAAGAAHEGGALLIATHLALCPACRDTVTRLERLGGALIAELPETPLAPGSREALLARLNEPEPAPTQATSKPRAAGARRASTLPAPLCDYLGGDLDGLPWRRIGGGIEQVEVPIGESPERARLLRLRPGTVIPRHTHRGTEMTLVLAGGFRDGTRFLQRGDVSVSDQQIDHRPIVDDDGEGCLCLSVTDAPLRFTGFFGRILNLFVRY